MAENKKHIDDLAKEIMQDFKPAAPSKYVWKNIKRKLFFHNISRRMWFWFSISSVLIIGYFVFAGAIGDNNGVSIQQHYDLRKDAFSLNKSYQSKTLASGNKEVNKLDGRNKMTSTGANRDESMTGKYKEDQHAVFSGNNEHKKPDKATYSRSSNPSGNMSQEGLLLSGTYNYDDKNAENTSDNNKADQSYNDEESKLAWELMQKRAEAESQLNNDEQVYSGNTEMDNEKAKNSKTAWLSFARPISVSTEIYGELNYTGFREQSQFSVPSYANDVILKETKPEWNFAGGLALRFDYSLFFIQADMNYQTYRTELKYQWQQTQIIPKNQWDVDTINGYNIDTIGSYYDTINDTWQYETDTAFYQNIDSSKIILSDTLVQDHSITTFQQLQYWEFPLLIGHSWNTGNWDLEASTGVAFGFYTGSSGKIIRNGNYEIYSYDKQNLPFRDMNLTWIGRAGAAYRIDDRWSILGRLSMRYSLNNIYDDDYLTNRRLWSYGINLGLRYKL